VTRNSDRHYSGPLERQIDRQFEYRITSIEVLAWIIRPGITKLRYLFSLRLPFLLIPHPRRSRRSRVTGSHSTLAASSSALIIGKQKHNNAVEQ
jgi:hypothetical protein